MLIASVFIGIFFWDKENSTTSSELQAKTNSLAILGFANKTGDKNLDWLETGLPEILLTDLAQNDVLHIISRERIIDCFPLEKRTSHTYDECVKVAQELGAVNLLSGSFYKLGDKIRIDARLEDASTGNVIKGIKVIGDDPFMLVDSLTQKIAVLLNISDELAGNKNVTTFVSSSPEAYQHYLKGMDYFSLALYEEAINELEEAIIIDSTFALSYMRIGMTFRIVY